MTNSIKRYWCRSFNNILDHTGFLYNPDDKYFFGKEIQDIEDITNNSCVLLCNIPKEASSEFYAYYKKEQGKDLDNAHSFYDISSYANENRLIKDIFESNIIEIWKQSTNNLYLYIDGFDLCANYIPAISQIFICELQKLNNYRERLYIRILSSSGLWSTNLERFMSTFWGESNSTRLSIAPLRQKDVLELCNSNNIDGTNFIDIINEKKVQPLAITPSTLHFLLNHDMTELFQETYGEELFDNACRIICENSISIINNTDIISANKMVAIASRIAAIMTFCKKEIISINLLNVDNFNVLSISEIFEEEETTGEYKFTICRKDIIQTLTYSGLFYQNTSGYFSFYHQAYQDFLSAKFIINHEYDKEKIISLLTNSKDSEGKLFEWVKGAYFWIQNMTTKLDLLEYFISHDPLKVLNGKIVDDDKIKEELVKNILEKFNKAEIIDEDWGILSKNGRKLYHPNIIEQLRPYISDPSKHILARRNAMEIAEACKLTELQNDLWRLVLDTNESIDIKEQAMSSLSKLVDDKHILEGMVKLAAIDNANDDNDRLKGYALNTTVETMYITTKQVFECITIPKNRHSLFGIYDLFLNYILPKKLEVQDIPFALPWVQKHIGEHYDSFSPFKNLYYRILWLCWDNYNDIDKDTFTETIMMLLKVYAPIFPVKDSSFDNKEGRSYSVSPNIRFDVVDKILSKHNEEQMFFIEFFSSHLILHDDFEAIVAYCKISQNVSLWKKILTQFSYQEETRKKIIEATFPNDLDTTFKYVLSETPVINIPERVRETEKEEKQKNDEAKKYITDKLSECISNYNESRDSKWWIYFFRFIATSHYNGHYHESDILSSNITEINNWKLLNPDTHIDIVTLAKLFIENSNDDYESWFGKNLYSYQASAGFKSLIIIDCFDDKYMDTIDGKVLEKWAHIILSYSENSETTEHHNRKQKLIKYLFDKAQEVATDIVKQKLIQEDKSKDSYLFALRLLDNVRSQSAENMLFDLIDAEDISNKSRITILTRLIDINPHKTFSKIKELIPAFTDDKALILSSLLDKHNDNEKDNDFWDFVYKEIGSDSALEKECYLKLSKGMIRFNQTGLLGLNESHLAFLYERLYNLFNPDEDPKYDGVHYVGEREEVAYLRDNLLCYLTNMGTTMSVKELKRLKKVLPNAGIEFSIVKAKDYLRNVSFDKISASDFQRLSRNGQFRIVSNGEELLKLIEESLIRLEFILQGTQPMSSSLWDVNNVTSAKPKKEEHLSDYIASHLRQDLERYAISPYREVQFRCKRFTKGDNVRQGENIDILVDCDFRGKNSRVIIEIKGSWNREILTSMRNQLYDRYMQTDRCDYGLYLVGWYCCSFDDRNEINCDCIENAKEYFEQQSEELSKANNINIKSFVLDCRLRN